MGLSTVSLLIIIGAAVLYVEIRPSRPDFDRSLCMQIIARLNLFYLSGCLMSVYIWNMWNIQYYYRD